MVVPTHYTIVAIPRQYCIFFKHGGATMVQVEISQVIGFISNSQDKDKLLLLLYTSSNGPSMSNMQKSTLLQSQLGSLDF